MTSLKRGETHGEAALLHGGVTREVIGAFFDVYNTLGYGFAEVVYRRSLALAMRARGLSVAVEVPLLVHFMGHCVGEYRCDLMVDGRVIVEVKAVERIIPAHDMQLLNYLKATGTSLGLILNFGPRGATWRRLIQQARACAAER